MTDLSNITNDSIVLNDVLSQRCGVERIELLDAKCHAEVSFVLTDGMIRDWKIKKKGRVKR